MNTENLTRFLGKTKLTISKYSPEILLVTGIVSGVTAAVMACKATLKAPEKKETFKKNVEMVQNAKETDEKYNEKKELSKVYRHYGYEMVKLYAPSVLLGTASIVSIISSHGISKKRQASLAAAYATIDSAYKNYRKNVIEKFGKETDFNLKNGVEIIETIEKEIDENGEEKEVQKLTYSVNLEPSDYAVYFDEVNSTAWKRDAGANLSFLKAQQLYCNHKLTCDGYLYLDEVYKILGIDLPKNSLQKKASRMVGWVYEPGNPKRANYVDFNLYNDFGMCDNRNQQKRNFINGSEYSVLLDFNVDGCILDYV